MDLNSAAVVWVVFSAMLVLLAQAGFAAVTAGLTRPKNAVSVTMNRLSDAAAAGVLFWLLGFGLMYGASAEGWIGTSGFFTVFDRGAGPTQPGSPAFFALQLAYCTAALTVLSGATAERMTFRGYLVVGARLACRIDTGFGPRGWAVDGRGGAAGWLRGRGFVDLAGGTVVHSLGGWLALAALVCVGNRTGRYNRSGQAVKIPGQSVPLAVLGVFLIWIGWIGWNGASAPLDHGLLPRIVTATMLAAAAGGLAALFLGWYQVKVPEVEQAIRGILAGLVASAAGCHALGPLGALVTGAIAGVVAVGVENILERLRIDDAIGAVAIHLGGGVWGTLAVGLFGDLNLLGTGHSRTLQIMAQLEGIAVAAAWGFGAAFIGCKLTGLAVRLRVAPEDELAGLNVSEHRSGTEFMTLEDALALRDREGEVAPLVEPLSELGLLELDDAGRVVSSNPVASAMFGFSQREFVGVPITTLFARPRDGEALDLDALRRLYGDAAVHEARGARRTGEDFPMEVAFGRSGGEREAVVVSLRDITLRKEHQEGLARTQAQIRARLDRELETTRVVASERLPADPEIAGAEVAIHVATAPEQTDVWFGYLYDGDGQAVTLYTGEIVGQASTASLLSGLLDDGGWTQELTHGLLLGDGRFPAERQLRNLADVLNRIVVQIGKGELLLPISFLHVDLQTGDLTLLDAGRRTPFYHRSGRTLKELGGGGGRALGIAPDPDVDVKRLAMIPGDFLVMVPDGLVDIFGPDGRVLRARELRRLLVAGEDAREVCDAVVGRARGVWSERDVHSVLALRWRPSL